MAILDVFLKILEDKSNKFSIFEENTFFGIILILFYLIFLKRLSLGENWLIYNTEETAQPLFSVKKHVTLLPSKGLAHVTPCRLQSTIAYSIEGSYSQHKYAIYDRSTGRTVAEVRPKEAAVGVTLGGDVFRLAVQSGLDLPLAMTMVIILEQIYGP